MESKMAGLYELGSSGLVPLTSEGKDDLPVGTILHLNGYNEPDYVIVKNLGKHDRSYGTIYQTVNVETLGQGRHEAALIKWENEKRDNRIQVYITNKRLLLDEVASIWQRSEDLRLDQEQKKQLQQAEYNRLVDIGRQLFKKYIPDNAVALLVAKHDVNQSDVMTDYFAHSTSDTVILGYSMHKRDLFTEMRKAAALIPETKDLATAPPEAEHREKYSMGDGYYLKASHSDSSGWRVEKENKYKDWGDGYYYSIAKRCIFEDKQSITSEAIHVNGVVRHNDQLNGIEVSFPTKPCQAVIEGLKGLGFRWSNHNKLWYSKYTEALMVQVQLLVSPV